MRMLTNFKTVENNGKLSKIGLPAADIVQKLVDLVHPIKLRNLAGEIVAIDDETNKVYSFRNDTKLFGWIAAQSIAVIWASSDGCLPRGDFFASLSVYLTEIVGVRDMPHEPPLADVHYLGAHKFGDTYTGALDELASFWLPHTPYDMSLIKAAFCTPFWGGRPGGRPALSIESDGADNGRGIGKSQLMYAIGKIVGGYMDAQLQEDIGDVKKRILSEGARTSVVCFDNCKTAKLSSGDLEGLITAPSISGWKPYVGNGTIPNYLTYAFSMNDASFSADMSSRSVRIVLSRQPPDPTWEARLDAFIASRRLDIVSDCIWLLKRPSVEQTNCIRFSSWQRDVLSKIDPSDELAALLKSRQTAVDSDADAASDLRGIVMLCLEEHVKPGIGFETKPLDPERDWVLIQRAVMCTWLRSRLDRAMSDRAFTTMLQRAKIPDLLDVNDVRHGNRYWRWCPKVSEELHGAWRIDKADKKVPAKWHEFRAHTGAEVIDLHQHKNPVNAPNK